MTDRIKSILVGAAAPITAIVIAELYMQLSDNYNSYAFAPPSAIARSFINQISSGALLQATTETLSAAATGLFFGTILGVGVGVILGLIRPFDKLMEVTLETLRTIPFIVLIPMLMMMLGAGLKMEATSIAIGAFWPNFIMSRAAVRQIEPRLLEVSRVLGLDPARAAFKVLLPAIIPRLMVGFRMALGFALLGAVSVEITANPQGVGNAMMLAQQSLHPDTMFAYLIWIGVLGWALNLFIEWFEKRLLWRFQLSSSKS